MQSHISSPKKLIIVGAGFAGIKLARELAKSPHYQITLISDTDHFKYYPLLYSTATGHTRVKASFPVRQLLFDKPQIEFVQDRVVGIDSDKHVVTTESGTRYTYDIAALAMGVVTSYFNIPGLEEHSFGTKSIEQALHLRRHLHAEVLRKGHKKHKLVVAGGGPTGVELAAGMVGYLRRVARLHGLPDDKISIDLIEAGPRVLKHLPEKGSAIVARRLGKLGVKVVTGKMVESQTPDSVTISGEHIKAETVVWTAGVSNHPFLFDHAHHFTFSQHRRVEVDQYLMAAPDIYVLGDNAATPFCGLAMTAVGDGSYLAKHLKRLAAGKTPKPYHPHHPISVVPCGKGWAVAQYRKLFLTGPLASLLRRAADFIGYFDIAPLPVAISLWLADHKIEDDCPVCRQPGH